MFVAQSRFLQERLVTTFGYRIDDVTTYRGMSLREPGFGPFAVGNLYAVPGDEGIEAEGRTQTTGGVFHFTDWLAGFYNQSKSFAIPNLNRRVARGEPAPSPTGVGRDYGVKFSFLGGRLFTTISYYETSARNDSAALNAQFSSGNLNLIWEALEAEGILAQQGINMDDVRADLNGFTFDSDSEGFEFELVANPTPGWRVLLNFADTKTVQTNTARELLDYVAQHRGLWEQHTDLPAGNNTVGALLGIFDDDAENRFIRPEGARKMGDSRYSGNLRTNYTFRQGVLKGFSAGFGVRWRGAPVLGYTAADPATREAIMGDDTLLADLNLAYRFTPREIFGRRVEISTQLNVNNVFKEDDLVPTRVFDDGQIRTYRFQVPRDIFLTTTFRF
jgi:outer membrane receptor for ferric coprogen and ferric-rhodotorulic acid